MSKTIIVWYFEGVDGKVKQVLTTPNSKVYEEGKRYVIYLLVL